MVIGLGAEGVIARQRDASCTSPCILHTFQSVCPPHGQWPAPLGSWRVIYNRNIKELHLIGSCQMGCELHSLPWPNLQHCQCFLYN